MKLMKSINLMTLCEIWLLTVAAHRKLKKYLMMSKGYDYSASGTSD